MGRRKRKQTDADTPSWPSVPKAEPTLVDASEVEWSESDQQTEQDSTALDTAADKSQQQAEPAEPCTLLSWAPSTREGWITLRYECDGIVRREHVSDAKLRRRLREVQGNPILTERTEWKLRKLEECQRSM